MRRLVPEESLAARVFVSRGRLVWAGLVFLAVSFGVSYLHYPFFMTGDSWIWLGQARSGNWINVQPVGVVALWSVLDKLNPGPLLFVLLNISLVVGGTVWILLRSLRSLPLGIILAAFCVFYPVTFSVLGVAWRDITGLGLVLIALGCVARLFDDRRGTSRARLVSSVALIALVGPVFRYNDAAGMAPILFTALYLSLAPVTPGWNARKRGALALAVSVLFLSIATVSAMRLTNRLASTDLHGSQAGLNHLLGRLSVETGTNLMPAELYPDLTLDEIRDIMTKYRSGNVGFYAAFWRQDNPRLPRLTSASEVRRLERAYGEAVRRYPAAALKMRLDVLGRVLFELPSSNHHVDFYYAAKNSFPAVNPNPVEVDFDNSAPRWSRSPLKKLLPATARWLPGHPLGYLLGGALAAFAAVRMRLPNGRLIALLSISAATHYLGVVLAVQHYENRLGHQSIYLGVLGIGLFVGSWLENRSRITTP